MQSLGLQQIAPIFLEEKLWKNSEVWGKHLVFDKGQYIQIVAPSGTGKTSLIHFLYGLRHDHSGNILKDGINIKTLDATALAAYRKDEISIVFQDLRLFTGHTALENVEIKRKLSPYHKNSEIESMCDRLGITEKKFQLAGTCSYGEQQRIAILRALQQPFDFLVLDEPFSHLDEANREKAMELILVETSLRNAGIILADLKPIPYFPAHKTIYL